MSSFTKEGGNKGGRGDKRLQWKAREEDRLQESAREHDSTRESISNTSYSTTKEQN